MEREYEVEIATMVYATVKVSAESREAANEAVLHGDALPRHFIDVSPVEGTNITVSLDNKGWEVLGLDAEAEGDDAVCEHCDDDIVADGERWVDQVGNPGCPVNVGGHSPRRDSPVGDDIACPYDCSYRAIDISDLREHYERNH